MKKNTDNKAAVTDKQESYRLAKLIRQGNRELMRQLNIKRSRRGR